MATVPVYVYWFSLNYFLKIELPVSEIAGTKTEFGIKIAI